ncbi:hypothetical protein VNO78_15457 [Psophocarpus tetragonolobus]|uniref:Late embryogenesis abundant protein LEA-2 subgroup domain-containing protein n=1 Tax=Psophocarpus tetragonolobus TaxID=3891 RepID=A0AAN9XJX0_PSOTE
MKKGSGCKGISICLVMSLCIVIAFISAVVILELTVFKPKHPITKVESINLQDMSMGMDLFNMRLVLNVTLDVDVSVNNTNVYGLMYYNSSATLNYRGQMVGEAPIPDGTLLSDETKDVRVTLVVMADRLVSHSGFTRDVASSVLPLNTLVKIFGQVYVLGLIKFHVASTLSCDFILSLTNRTVAENHCQSMTKILG